MSSPTVILCVDDEPKGLMVRRLLLSIAGYDVLTAGSGDIALRILRRNHVDLVITDCFLPDLPGAQIVSEIRRLKPYVSIVLLTNSVDPPAGTELVDLLLIKCMKPPEFLSEIAKLVAQQRSDVNGLAPAGK